MIINFIGLFNAPGYVGEVSDETHIARELEDMGHIVRRIPRDEWREFVIEQRAWDKYKGIPTDLRADINIVAKWHHFYDGIFISELRDISQAPVFYWVWDFMFDSGFPDWHLKMAQQADLYLSGEAGVFDEYKKLGIKPYYFQMDVCDLKLETVDLSTDFLAGEQLTHDVIFTGSCLGQGHRREWLQAINREILIEVWGWNYEEWEKLGFKAYPAIYGNEYNKLIAQSKVVLGFSVEPNCWGYWSNRVGKVIRAGGNLLQEYAPGMEQFLPQSVEYFSTPEEAIEKIKYFLQPDFDRVIKTKMQENFINGRKFTSNQKVLQLTTLMERFLKGDPLKWNKLP